MPQCVGVKTNGDHCTTRAATGLTRCRVHQRTLENKGPFTCARDEKYYEIRKALRDFQDVTQQLVDAAGGFRAGTIIREDREHEYRLLELRLNRELELLIRQQQDEIERTGVDPDHEARQRNNQRLRERDRMLAEREHAELVALQARLLNQHGVAAAGGGAPPQEELGELRRFAHDNQNVHTTAAVNMTKEVVNRILKIPVPDEYKWNSRVCSKTPGEIVVRCRLTPRAAWQMISKYCQAETIYEMGEGIYGKVLDGVWQYILKMEDSDGICQALRQEMEDSIGMCAQGNLSRICNILAGYMEGIGSQESPVEILGRKIPTIMNIPSEALRLTTAIDILREVGMPRDQWMDWIAPLFDDDKVVDRDGVITLVMST